MDKFSKLIMRRNPPAGSISKPDPTGKNPTVLVHGIGQLSLEQLKKEIASRLGELTKKASAGEFDFVFYHLVPAATTPTFLQSLVRAYMDVTAELEKQAKDADMSKNAPLNEMIEIWPDGRYGKITLKG